MWSTVLASALTVACAALVAPPALAASSSPAALDSAALNLHIGSAGPAVTILQDTLQDWHVSSSTTGTFTAATRQAIARAAAQVDAGQASLDNQLAAIGYGPRAATLQLGVSSPEVKALQRALTRAGDGVEATGVVGPQTQMEIALFQHAHGLTVTGAITLWQVEQLTVTETPTEVQAASNTPASLTLTVPQRIVQDAMRFVGFRYIWGAAGPWAFDCSGLVQYVFQQVVGTVLPHDSQLQWRMGTAVATADLQPGDLVFFNTDGPGASHVGIYLGGVDRDFIDATNPRTGVMVNTLDSAYWADHYIGARNVLG